MGLAVLFLATNVSFSAPAARLENLIPGLAAALGKKLEAAPECRDEVLLIDVKDVDADLLMKKVAEAADAEWQTKPDGTLLLARSIVYVNRERAAALAARAAEIKLSQNELREWVDGLPTFDSNEAQRVIEAFSKIGNQPVITPPRGGSPGNRLAARVLASLPATDLASMQDGDRVVYATRPTTWQRRMPGGLDGILNQFAQDQTVWSAEAATVEPGPGMLSTDSPVMSAASGRGPYSLHVTVRRYSSVSPAGATVTIMDRNGKAFVQSNAMLASKGLKAFEAPRVPGELWDLPAEGKEWGKATDLNYRGGTQLPGAELVEKTLHPDRFEPQSFVTGPSLVELAHRRGHGVVANLPDALLGAIQVRDGKVDLNGVERQLALFATHHDVSGPVEIVAPDDPLRARQIRANRHALASLASAVHLKGMLRLDDLATYAMVTPAFVTGWDGPSFYTLRILLPRAERLVQDADGHFLRLYGALTPAQRQSLRSGQISGMELSPAGKNALLDLVLNGGLPPEITDASRRMAPFESDVALDPTSFLPPSGISAFVLRGTSRTAPALLAGSPEVGKYSAWTSILIGGQRMIAVEGSEFWPGEVETYSLQVGTNGYNWRGSLVDHRIRLDKPPTAVDQLPAGLHPTFKPLDQDN